MHARIDDDVQPHRLAFYELPSITLRDNAPFSDDAARAVWPCATGGWAAASEGANGGWTYGHTFRGAAMRTLFTAPEAPTGVRITCDWEAWCATGQLEEEDAFARFGPVTNGAGIQTGLVTFAGTTEVVARVAGTLVVIADGLGRVVVADTSTGELVGDLRVGR